MKLWLTAIFGSALVLSTSAALAEDSKTPNTNTKSGEKEAAQLPPTEKQEKAAPKEEKAPSPVQTPPATAK